MHHDNPPRQPAAESRSVHPSRIRVTPSNRLRPLTTAAAILASLSLGISSTVANPAWGADSLRPSTAVPRPIADPGPRRLAEDVDGAIRVVGSHPAFGFARGDSRAASPAGAKPGRTTRVMSGPNRLRHSDATLNLPVVTAAGNQLYQGSAPDGAGGAIISWRDLRNGGDEIYAQHVMATRSIDPTWPANGVALSVGAGPVLIGAMATDGVGGAIVVWEDVATQVHAQHVRSTGVVDPAWGPAGIVVATTATGSKYPHAISDGSGGAFVTWQDSRNGTTNMDIFAMHLTSMGLDPAWPVDGLAVCTAPGNQRVPHLCTDGATGAIIAWSDLRTPANAYDIYAQHVLVSGIADPAWPVTGAVVVARAGHQRLYSISGFFVILINTS